MPAWLRRIVSVILIAAALAAILFVGFQDKLLAWGIRKAGMEIKERTGFTLKIRTASFKGLTNISLKNISLIPMNGDTLVSIDTLNTNVAFWPLLTGTIRLKEIYCSGVSIMISCFDSTCNYQSMMHEKQTVSSKPERNYSMFFKRMLDRAFNLAPQKAHLTNVSFTYRNEDLERRIFVQDFFSDGTSITGTAEDEHSHSIWKCTGTFSQSDHTVQITVFPAEGRAFLPIVNDLLGLAVSFDTVRFGLDTYDWSKNLLTAKGNAYSKGLSVFHKRVSNDTIVFPSTSFDFKFRSGKTFLEIDSNSVGTLSQIKFKPFVRYENAGSKIYSLNINTEKTEANDFFYSLPRGMFDEVRDLSADGRLQFVLNFRIDASQPDSLLFDATLKKEKFRLKNFGNVELHKLNSDFIYSVYERDRYIRSFIVGSVNPWFTSLDSISPHFVNAVLTSEDGNFYFHNGFNEDAFRKSIITNFKAKKFVRGGSTISMQLVKNVFLNRKKTIARKAEEALLVWLIENNRLTSKQRMLEVYMNIIELGPDVYGAAEASSFYFNKRPQNLTLPEGIFLASLLPHPKWFKYSFDTLGNLKPYLADYYRVVSDFMLRKELISQAEHDSLKAHVVLTGTARDMILPKDSLPVEEREIFIMEN